MSKSFDDLEGQMVAENLRWYWIQK